MLVIPAMWEAWVGRLWSEVGPRQKHKILPENLLKQKGMGVWLIPQCHPPKANHKNEVIVSSSVLMTLNQFRSLFQQVNQSSA
jgi:hypothetical protein